LVTDDSLEGAATRTRRWAGWLNLGLWTAWLFLYQEPFWYPFPIGGTGLAISALSCGLGMAGCWAWLQLVMRWRMHAPRALLWRSAGALAAPIAASVVLTGLLRDALVANMLVVGAAGEMAPNPLGFEMLDAWLGQAWVFFLYAGGALALLMLFDAAERERRLARALIAAREAQLIALKLQISPHFLFNALNAVSELIAGDRHDEAEATVAQLSGLFRAALAEAPSELARLEEEFELAAAYLAIERTRFAERLAVEIDLPAPLRSVSTPRFLLQPLIENVGKHVVARSKRTVTVTVKARLADDRLVLTVEDDGPGASQEGRAGHGIGLRSVAARLETLYGDRARLSTTARDCGFLSKVELPLEWAAPDGPRD
jgi:hypothetical protein